MFRTALICAFVCVLLVLAGCGKDEPTQEEALRDLFSGKGAGFPGAGGETDPTKVWEQMGKIELTDAMMESYVKLIEKMQSAAGRPDAAMLKAYSLNWQQWAAIGGAVARAQVATSKSKMVTNLEKQIEKTQKKLDEAPESRKQSYRDMLRGYRQSLASMKDLPDATDLDRKNQAVIERWMDRIRAAGSRK